MSKVTLHKVRFSNFGSFGKEFNEVQLDTGHTWMISGQNNDTGDTGESFNGAGKTLIMKAIIYAIYGTDFEKVSADQLVNLTNGKKMIVELDMTINGKPYQIVRGRKPSMLELSQGDISLTRDSMANTDKEISALIGISFDVFIRTVFMNSHIEPFMAMTSANQRNMMESILSLDVLADRASTLKDVVRKETQDSIKLIDRDLQNALITNEKIHKQIAELTQKSNNFEISIKQQLQTQQGVVETYTFDVDKANAEVERLREFEDLLDIQRQKLNESEAQIEHITKRRVDEEHNKKTLARALARRDQYTIDNKSEFSAAESALKKLPKNSEMKQYFDVCEDIKKGEDTVTELKRTLINLTREEKLITKDLNSTIDHAETLASGKCPTCEQEHFDEEKLDELATKAEAMALEVEDIETSINVTTKAIERTTQEVTKLRDEATEILASNGEIENYSSLQELSTKRESLTAIVERLHSDNPHEITVCDLELDFGGLADIEDRIVATYVDIDSLNKDVTERNNDIDSIEVEKGDLMRVMKFKTKEAIESGIRELEVAKKELQRIGSEVNPYEGMVESQEVMLVDVDQIESEKAALELELTHVNYLIKLLTDPKSFVRKNIVDQYLPFLNKKITEYSNLLGITHVASINPDMTTDIEYLNKNVSYFTMSRGERLRLNVATSLAFRDLIGVLGHSCNILLVDELLDSASDPSGVRGIFGLLKGYVDDVFIISHKSEFKDQVDKNLTVVKTNGFADIEIS